MKYILILLVSFAFGQMPSMTYINGQWYNAEELKEKEMKEIKEYLFGTEMPDFYAVKIPTLVPDKYISKSDILDYAEECYNDSTFVDRTVYIRGKFINNPYWTHKEPTFSGFIKWLRSK